MYLIQYFYKILFFKKYIINFNMKIFHLEDYSNEENVNLEDCIYKKKNQKFRKKYKNKKDIETKLNLNSDFDENNEKIVFLNFNLKLNRNEKLKFDIVINKELYLLIGKELFS